MWKSALHNARRLQYDTWLSQNSEVLREKYSVEGQTRKKVGKRERPSVHVIRVDSRAQNTQILNKSSNSTAFQLNFIKCEEQVGGDWSNKKMSAQKAHLVDNLREALRRESSLSAVTELSASATNNAICNIVDSTGLLFAKTVGKKLYWMFRPWGFSTKSHSFSFTVYMCIEQPDLQLLLSGLLSKTISNQRRKPMFWRLFKKWAAENTQRTVGSGSTETTPARVRTYSTRSFARLAVKETFESPNALRSLLE